MSQGKIFCLLLAVWGLPGVAAIVLAEAIAQTGFSVITLLCGGVLTTSIGLLSEAQRAWYAYLRERGTHAQP